MSASQKATGGRQNAAAEASGRKTRGSGRSAARSVELLPESGSVPRGTKSNDAAPLSSRAEAIRAKTPKRSRGASTEPPRYSNRSARPRVIEAAQKMAAEHGYERLRLKHITDEAAISHQAFYGHFANKRHAVAVATSDDLGAIADLANRGSRKDEEWAERMLEDIDKTLAATYPATDGPERWLRDRITKAIATEGGFSALRIIELIRVSKLGHGEFYRRYGGKRGCLQKIYGEALEEIRAEAGESPSVAALGAVLASDRGRAELLILGAAYLPDGSSEEDDQATRSSLLELLADLVSLQLDSEAPRSRALVIAGGLLEVIRSSVLGGRLGELDELAELRSFDQGGAQFGRLGLAA